MYTNDPNVGISGQQWQVKFQDAWQGLAMSKGVKLAILPTFNATRDPPLCAFYGTTAVDVVGIVPIPCSQIVSLQILVCQEDLGGGNKNSFGHYEIFVGL